jgi:predicted ATPase with chaperone activity
MIPSTASAAGTGFRPPIPRNAHELDIPLPVVIDLVMRRVLADGTVTLSSLCETLKLSQDIVQDCFRQLKQQQLIEVKGMEGDDFFIGLSQAGRKMAMNRMKLTQYSGPAPVSLAQYKAAVRAQVSHVKVTRESLREALSELVVTDDLLDQIGPALVSQKSLFLYGSTGNGKTSIAERLLRIYSDTILIPYSVYVDGQVINLFDPVVHVVAGEQDEMADPRWIRTRRPFVVIGGELTSSMLELQLDHGTRVYAAPLQMKANNGILAIDDFGRQVMSPRKLLNRWIVPLDRRVDYLSLRHGVKFEIPFELMVVFATNLDPSELADDAFLRRLPNKVLVPPVSPEVFDRIFKHVVEAKGIPYEPGSPAYLRRLCKEAGCKELRACYPRDICNIVEAMGMYQERPPTANKEDLQSAMSVYFARTQTFTDL